MSVKRQLKRREGKKLLKGGAPLPTGPHSQEYAMFGLHNRHKRYGRH